MIKNFREQLRIQRWDDHRYYHHSRINQALHLLSAISFVCAYMLVFFSPVAAVLVACRHCRDARPCRTRSAGPPVRPGHT